MPDIVVYPLGRPHADQEAAPAESVTVSRVGVRKRRRVRAACGLVTWRRASEAAHPTPTARMLLQAAENRWAHCVFPMGALHNFLAAMRYKADNATQREE